MADFESLRILDFDHLEFVVNDLDKSAELYFRLGFEIVGRREIAARKLKSVLLSSGDCKIVLSHSNDTNDPVSKYLKAHGEGVLSVAYLCEDAFNTFEKVVGRGAKPIDAPRTFSKDFGSQQEASVACFGDVRSTFVSRKGTLFAEGFDQPYKTKPGAAGLLRIDHITNNVPKGEREKWVKFYEDIFGLKSTRFFDIHTARTGLYSNVMQSPNGVIKMPFNEPTEAASQIQEFLDIHHGPGVQHVALATSDILTTLPKLKKEGILFLDAPPITYYEAIPSRVPGVTEDLREVQDLSILIDGDDKGYLLQIFTQNVIGPFFYEVIQRKGNDGFGEGNFGALFEAIERDQVRRGVLK